MNSRRSVVLVAGGTGGHVFPALSVAQVWTKRGTPVVLFTDERAQAWAQGRDVPWKVVVSRFKETSRKCPKSLKKVVFALRLLTCGIKSLVAFICRRPMIVVGFGGYPSAPVVLAARILRIPYILHECNASLGRANEILLSGAKALTLGFQTDIPQASQKGIPVVFTGNPVREDIAHLAEKADVANKDVGNPSKKGSVEEPFCLFVVGGSQGANLFSQVVPEALRLLCMNRSPLRIEVHEQVRPTDLSNVEAFYQNLSKEADLTFDLRPFFEDMPKQLLRAHLVIARSGALTLSELAAAGCPSILIPLACSISNDQAANAEQFRQNAAAVVLEESVFTPKHLCFVLNTLLQAPEALEQMRGAARNLFVPHASEHLVEVAEHFGITATKRK